MHIALYSPGWPVDDYHNGVVTYVRHMREGLVALGHKVSIVSPVIGPSNRDSDVYCVEAQPFTKWRYKVLRKLGLADSFDFSLPIAETFRRVHEKSPIDLIEMEESFGHCLGVQSLGIPLVVKLHGPAFLSLVEEELDGPFAKAKIELEGRALAAARFITSPSQGTLDDTVARFSLDAKTAHARNPLDPATMPVWDIDKSVPYSALFVGRFDKRKGADTVLQAFRIVLQEMHEATLTFVGPDRGITQPDGSLIHFEDYVNILFTPAQRKHIRYVGTLAPEAIEQLRLEARVTVVASRWESAGYTATEAMAQGCPVAAIDCGGVREVVICDETGLISVNAETLAADIMELMYSPEKAARLGKQARQFVFDTHAPSVAVPLAARFYEEVIGATPRD
jgi:glycosyltransferase involved in cell wall biosynthesis